jgi:23S rRNA maturation mini-RNase III
MPRRPDPELEKKKIVFMEPKGKPFTPEMRRFITKEKEVELRAKAELDHESKLRAEAEAAFLEKAAQELIEEKQPEQAKRPIYIDLPPEAPYLLTNGNVCYYPDTEYEVTKEVYDDLNSRMWCAWVNEANRLDDQTANQYKRSRNIKIGRKGTTHE